MILTTTNNVSSETNQPFVLRDYVLSLKKKLLKSGLISYL